METHTVRGGLECVTCVLLCACVHLDHKLLALSRLAPRAIAQSCAAAACALMFAPACTYRCLFLSFCGNHMQRVLRLAACIRPSTVLPSQAYNTSLSASLAPRVTIKSPPPPPSPSPPRVHNVTSSVPAHTVPSPYLQPISSLVVSSSSQSAHSLSRGFLPVLAYFTNGSCIAPSVSCDSEPPVPDAICRPRPPLARWAIAGWVDYPRPPPAAPPV